MPKSATFAVPAFASSAAESDLGPDVSVPVPEKGWPLRLGVLTEHIPPELVDEAVADAGRLQRRCRLLPARAVVYFVLGLCLFSGADSAGPPGYRSVLRSLTHGLRHVYGLRLPTSAALTRARQRLGAEPLQALFARVRGPLATAGTPGTFAFGRRVVAWDGTGIDTADTPANAETFGRAGVAGHPQLRLLALIECGTHGVLHAAFDGFHLASEHVLARRVLGGLRPGMLLLADRNFPGHQLWGLATGTGADLAWRLKCNHVFLPVRRLSDGSFLSVMATPAENVRYGQARAAGRPLSDPPQGHLVRIIEYTVTVTAADGGRRVEPFRLVTSLLDSAVAPAAELAARYHERWESELGYGELKTRLRGAAVILRSRSPELVGQEMFAFLIVYQALCVSGPVRPAGDCGADRRHRSRPDLLHHHRPPGPRPGGQPGRRNSGHPVAGLPADHHRPAQRSTARPPVTGLPAGQAPREEHLPDQKARSRPTTEQGQIRAHGHRRQPLPGQTP
jgi:hypothetical protein